MRLAISSDWHGMKPNDSARKQIESCDLLLLCGDIFESGGHNEKLITYFRKLRADGKQVIMTPGNHDWFLFKEYLLKNPNEYDHYGHLKWDVFQKHPFESMEQFEAETGIKVLVDEEIEVNGIRIYGTPWSPEFCGWAFMDTENGLRYRFDKIPEGLDILLSHTPPNDGVMKIDHCEQQVYSSQPEHLGSIALFEAIIDKQPKYFACGHIHTGSHEDTKILYSTGWNVSYVDEEYQPSFPIRIIEV